MTALLVLERGDLDRQVTVSENAVRLPAGSARVGLLAGEVVRVRDLLGGMMTSSGNDAANALAEALGGDMPGFVQMMNSRAAELGMTGSNFTNPSGLHDEGQYSTAFDIAILTDYAMHNDQFRELAALPSYVMPATNKHPFSGWALLFNTNRFLNFGETVLSSDLIERYLGVKTGSTFQAGNNLVTAAVTRGGHELISVIFGVPADSIGNVYIYSRALLETAAAMLPDPQPTPTPTPTIAPTPDPTTTNSHETIGTSVTPQPTRTGDDADSPVREFGAEYFWRTAFFVLAVLCLVLAFFDLTLIRRLKRRNYDRPSFDDSASKRSGKRRDR